MFVYLVFPILLCLLTIWLVFSSVSKQVDLCVAVFLVSCCCCEYIKTVYMMLMFLVSAL